MSDAPTTHTISAELAQRLLDNLSRQPCGEVFDLVNSFLREVNTPVPPPPDEAEEPA